MSRNLEVDVRRSWLLRVKSIRLEPEGSLFFPVEMDGTYQYATSQANGGDFEKADVRTGLRANRALRMRSRYILVVLEGLKTSAALPCVICVFQWLSGRQI